MDEWLQTIIDDLTAELQITDTNFNSDLLKIKVKGAANEVKRERSYPSSYTDEMVLNDIAKYYDVVRNIALYDYVTVGNEFQQSGSENSVTRTWIDRNSLFAGVTPLAKF